MLEDRRKMYLMAKNQDGTFLKLGTIKANLVGTVYDLRHDITSVLSDDLKDKKFVMMKETLKDIDGSLEKKVSVSEVYSSDCVLIRFVNETGKVLCYYYKSKHTVRLRVLGKKSEERAFIRKGVYYRKYGMVNLK